MGEQNGGFTIKIVAERTGVSVHTLRAWERRYGIPSPGRDAANHYRLYDERAITDVLWLKHQIESGLSPAIASAMRHQQQAQLPSSTAEKVGQPLAELSTTLENVLAASDEPAAQRVLDQAFALFAPEQIALEIIQPTMYGLGMRWQRREIDVWQEHVASNVIRQRILSFMQAQPEPPQPTLSLMAACAPEEQHELGLLLVALLARRKGWQVKYMGQRTPLSDVLPFMDRNRIAISVSTPTGLASLMPLLHNKALPREHLFFGGYLPNRLPALREHLPGVFLGFNAPEAVRLLSISEPKANTWTASKRALRDAMALQQARLKLGWQTVEQLPTRTRSGKPDLMTIQPLTEPTLFFIDALSSALAFDVPELMDEQVVWLRQALPPRNVGMELLKEYIKTFRRAARQNLEADTANHVEELLDRLQFDSLGNENSG